MQSLRSELLRRYNACPEAGEYFTFPVFYAVLCEKRGLERDGLKEPESALREAIFEDAQTLLSGYPLQYYLGYAEFAGLSFAVREGVLIPRADTETLVEEARRVFDGEGAFYDLCCGSGCIGISLLKQWENAVCIAVDVSDSALALTRENAALHGVSERILTRRRDLLTERAGEQKLPLLCMNPPYIQTNALETLPGNVRREPSLALDGGDDGLRFYKRILPLLPEYLVRGGKALLEIGFDEEQALQELCAQYSYSANCLKDAGGKARVISIRI